MFPLLILTDQAQARRPLLDVVAASVEGGARLIVVREKDLPAPQRLGLASQIEGLLAQLGGQVLLGGTLSWHGGHHLAADDPWPPPGGGLLGRSCHTREEVALAAARGAGYATLSPVFPTRSKPGYGPPLGPDALRGPLPIPTYALGGIDSAERAHKCMLAGAGGVAVMGTIMRAADPAAATAEVLAAVLAAVQQVPRR
ncbi:MAG: thiamine phosphate synthase [Micromonosporaceae bacterium]|nr:thiamine phosphate synthase [Micromonosporaceae bacterium]